jgi:PAB1-binding protein PBP1
MDRKRVIGEVAARHGVRLEEDDPAFLLVTIAEIALRDAQAEFVQVIRRSIAEQEAAGERIQTRMGEALGDLMRTHSFNAGGPEGQPPRKVAMNAFAVGAVGGFVLFIAGLLVGGRCL